MAAPYTLDPFTGKRTAATTTLDQGRGGDDIIERLLKLLTEGRTSERSERQDMTRRRMHATNPTRARQVERNVRRERGRDRAEAGRPGNVVRQWERGGTAKPPNSTFVEAGTTEEASEDARAEANKERYRRLLGKKEEKLARGTEGSFSLTGPDGKHIEGGGGPITEDDTEALKERIRRLKQLAGVVD